MKFNEIETREHAILRALIRETLMQQSNMTNEGFMDSLKSLVSSLLGVSQKAFQSSEGMKDVVLSSPSKDSAASNKFDPLKDPESQLIAVKAILQSVSYALELEPRIQSLVTQTKETLDESESISNGTHPEIKRAKDVAEKSGHEAYKKYVEDVTNIYTDGVKESYSNLLKNIASAYGYFAKQLTSAKFSNEDWYKNVMEIGKSAKVAETLTKTLDQWKQVIVKIEKLQLASKAKEILESKPVQSLLDDENKARYIQDIINGVQTWIASYENNISSLKSELETLYPLVKKLDELMGENAKVIDLEIKQAEEEAKSGEEAIKSSLLSHYSRGHSRILREGFIKGRNRARLHGLIREALDEFLLSQ